MKELDSNDAFLTGLGVDSRTRSHLRLIVEELALNVIKHGRRKEDSTTIDIRVVVTRGKIYLRMRDNCLRFNPLQYLPGAADRVAGKHLGLALVRAFASGIDYTYALGFNNLAITVTPKREEAA